MTFNRRDHLNASMVRDRRRATEVWAWGPLVFRPARAPPITSTYRFGHQSRGPNC